MSLFFQGLLNRFFKDVVSVDTRGVVVSEVMVVWSSVVGEVDMVNDELRPNHVLTPLF
jgi:hypothetical protein